ncbi:MAG: TetR/AcrR family transcriptional regulator [Candidatus Thorarchaeota archaeon]|jgi:AcrR family transcriptional regulator
MTSEKTPKKKKLRVRKKERTRKAILAAAEEFFSKKPMDEVNLEDIAEAAFVSRTTLYNYFKNKDAIFFEIGIQKLREMNRHAEENYPNDSPGIEQVLQLIEDAFDNSQDSPLIYDIIREFYKRINDQNIPLKELKAKITKSMGTSRFEKIIKGFEEPYLSEFYVQLLRNTDLWSKVIRKGKLDGTITNNLKDEQIAQFVYMLTSGIEEQMKLRKPTLTRIGFDNAVIIENMMNLIESLMQK